MSLEFTLAQRVNMPVETVYQAFTNDTMLADWWCDQALINLWTPTPVYYMLWHTGFHAMGHYTDIVENERLSFTWIASGETYIAHIYVTFAPADGGTDVVLEATNLDSEGQLAALKSHWVAGLENLASILETGHDLRITRRPMLGIYIAGAINDQNREKYGAPHGAILAGVIEGLSAEAIGLKHDDVITAVDGIDIPDFGALTKAMSGRKVGDIVRVDYVRGAQSHSADMELKSVPIKPIPETTADLANEMEEVFMELGAELDALLEGATEETASQKPNSDDWSVKEVLAHLIAAEGDDHARISTRLGNDRMWDSFYNNSQARVDAILATYPTLPALRGELERVQQQMVALIRALPADFTERKSAYRYVAELNLTHVVAHRRLHYDQITEAIALVST